MTRMRDSIKNAERAAWPAVKDALAEQATPIVIEKLARSTQVRSNIRFVVEETIQAIAAAGLLRTPADADVIGKAVNWHESWQQEFAAGADRRDVFDDEADDDLYVAIEAMLDEIGDRPDAP